MRRFEPVSQQVHTVLCIHTVVKAGAGKAGKLARDFENIQLKKIREWMQVGRIRPNEMTGRACYRPARATHPGCFQSIGFINCCRDVKRILANKTKNATEISHLAPL